MLGISRACLYFYFKNKEDLFWLWPKKLWISIQWWVSRCYISVREIWFRKVCLSYWFEISALQRKIQVFYNWLFISDFGEAYNKPSSGPNDLIADICESSHFKIFRDHQDPAKSEFVVSQGRRWRIRSWIAAWDYFSYCHLEYDIGYEKMLGSNLSLKVKDMKVHPEKLGGRDFYN